MQPAFFFYMKKGLPTIAESRLFHFSEAPSSDMVPSDEVYAPPRLGRGGGKLSYRSPIGAECIPSYEVRGGGMRIILRRNDDTKSDEKRLLGEELSRVSVTEVGNTTVPSAFYKEGRS